MHSFFFKNLTQNNFFKSWIFICNFQKERLISRKGKKLDLISTFNNNTITKQEEVFCIKIKKFECHSTTPKNAE